MKLTLGASIAANILSRVWPSFLGILFVPLYLKFMGAEAYGLVGFYLILQSVFGLLDFGIGSTLTRELALLSAVNASKEKMRDLVRTLEIVYFFIALISCIVVVIFAPMIGKYWLKINTLSFDELINAIRMMGIAVALQFPFGLYQGGMMGLQKQISVNLVLMIIGTIRAGGATLVLWLFSPSILAFMSWQIFCGAIGSAILMLLLWRNLSCSNHRPKFDLGILFDVRHYAATVSITALIGVFLTQSDKIILSHMLRIDEFAYYSVGATLASVIWIFIVPLNNVVFPRFVVSHKQDNIFESASLLHLSSNYLSLLILPTAAILIVFSKEILYLWTGNLILADNIHYVASLLVIGVAINGLCSVPAYAASAFGWPQLQMKSNLVQSIVIVPLLILSTNLFGAIGAAFVWVLLNSIHMVIMTPIFFRRYLKSECKEWYLKGLLIPIGITFLTIYLIRELIIRNNLNLSLPIFFTIWILILLVNIIFLKRIRTNSILYITRIVKYKL